ncbi:hypothetical protein [Natronosalvus rutilus]|uniref:Uncharacterized protein n=1 Tax=Natronosalvus rutilus TaxID=2953753 RepID=A0A9E7NDF5_9EURY|nr:hypothetical protein [Natronosalvus rutilus]UTF54983.1 hypothetical protein NGM29_06945 [Natronosalvus rutilus]
MADPNETRDVSDDNPEVVNRFTDVMSEHLKMAQTTDTDLSDIKEDKAVKQRLRELGYLD